MVQSSIVLPTTRKRSIDGTESTTEEIKRPRIEDSEAQQKRNKRLFGTLLGTLNKFKTETVKTSDIDKNRQAINEKLQEKLELEKKQLSDKLKARREEKLRLEEEKEKKKQKLIQDKIELSKLIHNEKLANFLKTKSEPTLYYLPEKLTQEMKDTIKQQKELALEARKLFETQDEITVKSEEE